MKLKETIIILLLAGVMAIIGNTMGYNMPAGEAAKSPSAPSRLRALVEPLRRRSAAAWLALALVVAGSLTGWRLLSGGSYRPSPDAERWYREGVAALRDGTYYKASQALERAARIDDHFAMAHAHLAESWLELDYTDKAKDEMLRAVPPAGRSRPARAEQWYLDALHFTMTGNYAQAIEKYREIAWSAPDDAKADAYVDLGRAWERNEKLPEAIAAYQEAIRRQRQNPAAWLRLGILYGRQADQPKAAEALGEAEQLYRGLSNLEGATEVLYQRGVLANRVGKVTEARTALAQALEMSGHTGSRSAEILALLQLSNLEFHAGNFRQSQADASQAIDLARANGLENLTTRGLIDLGNAYFQQGLNSQARKYFEQGLAAARRYHSVRSEARALLSLGSLEIQTGELDDGLGNVQQGYDWYQRGGYQKETAQALLLMSRAQRQKGDYPSALHSFEEELAWAQKNGDQRQAVQARQGIASVLELEGRWPEALAQCRQAYDAANQSSDRSDAAYSLLDASEVLWRLGRWDEARQALDRAVAGAPRALLLRADGIRAAMARQKALVDLYGVERNVLQLAETRQAGAEIVDRQARAVISDTREKFARIAIGGDGTFRHLQP